MYDSQLHTKKELASFYETIAVLVLCKVIKPSFRLWRPLS